MGYRVCQLILPITTYWIGEWQSLRITRKLDGLGAAKNSIVTNVYYKKKYTVISYYSANGYKVQSGIPHELKVQ